MTFQADIRNAKTVIRVWASIIPEPVMQKLADILPSLEPVLSEQGFQRADFLPPLPFDGFHFDEDADCVLAINPRVTLGSPQWDAVDTALREHDIVATALSFQKETTRLAHLQAHGLRVVESRNIPLERGNG